MHESAGAVHCGAHGLQISDVAYSKLQREVAETLSCFLSVANDCADLPAGACELGADVSADQAGGSGDHYGLAAKVLQRVGLLGNCNGEIARVAREASPRIRHGLASAYFCRDRRARFDPRSEILQNRRKKPIVRRRCTYPGAFVVNVITAHAMSIITAAMIPKSIIDFVDGEFARP
jgi:hypothetical protein